MEMPTYRRMLVEIGKRLRPAELESMKFMLVQHIPKRRMEEIKSSLQLFDAMEERELLGSENLATLRQLLIDSSEGRTDLVSLLDNALNGKGLPVAGRQIKASTAQPANANDLSPEFEYLSSNLGKSWKRMCRHLSGIREPDFDAAIEHHQRDLQEQITYILHLWQSRNPDTASREVLVNACKRAEMKLHAENIADQNLTGN